MNIVMVSYMDLTGPGVMHLYHFANELERQGHKVFVLLDGDPHTTELMEQPPLCHLAQIRFTAHGLDPALVRKIKAFRPDIVHIWTPRNVPARVGLAVKYHTDAKLVIHYEDDEDYLYDFHQGNVLGDLKYLVQTLQDPHSFIWKHPVVSFLANHFADAFTAICRPYLPRLERQWGKKAYLLYPGVDLERFHPDVDATDLRQHYGLFDQEIILYSGSISAFHQFNLVLQAFKIVAARRPHARLVHAGPIYIGKEIEAQVNRLGLDGRVHLLGPIPHKKIHRYLALGDVLVQCGEPNTFNEFRLPAKLPEYMAMGKPIITFSAGIGRELVDGKEVLKTYAGEPEELASKLEHVLSDPDLQRTLGRGARRKAEAFFNWQRNTADLIATYKAVLNNTTQIAVKPRIRPSIAGEAFGSWWQTREQRHILVVIGEAMRQTTELEIRRAASFSQALEAHGHRVTVAVPQTSTDPGIRLNRVQWWTLDGLNLLIWEVDPDVLLFTQWSALAALDPLLRRPVVLDLASGWSNSPGGTGELLRCLARADFILCREEADRANFLHWAARYGLQIEPDEVAVIPIHQPATANPVTSQMGADAGMAKSTAPQEDIAPLERFCRTPFVRQPMQGIDPDHKTFGMLIDEAIRNYRHGGVLLLTRATWGFLRRKLKG